MTIWYFTAWPGLTPARSWPVIIPGRLTMPTTIMALMVGMSPVRTACWMGSPPGKLPAEPVEPERDAVQGIAQDHPEEWDGILGSVPGPDAHEDEERERAHRPRAGPDRGDARKPDSGVAEAGPLRRSHPGDERHREHKHEDDIPAAHAEDPFENKPDEEQLDHGAGGRDEQPTL